MQKASKKLTVTAVAHVDSNVITAFFNELPGLVVQGDSDNDVKLKLYSLLQSYIKRLQLIGDDFDIKTRTLA